MSSNLKDCISLVLLFYNEEENVTWVVEDLRRVLDQAGVDFNLILVDNGSHDRTPDLIQRLVDDDSRLKKITVRENLGFGWGVISGLAAARSPWVGYMGGDGQVDPEDVVKLLNLRQSGYDLIKVRRTLRQDGFVRAWISNVYVMMTCILFGIPFYDVNATPRIFRRIWLKKFQLSSRDWFLDAELLIKSELLGLNLKEVSIIFQKREGGSSNVNLGTIFEFLKNIGKFRFGKELSQWKRKTLSKS